MLSDAPSSRRCRDATKSVLDDFKTSRRAISDAVPGCRSQGGNFGYDDSATFCIGGFVRLHFAVLLTVMFAASVAARNIGQPPSGLTFVDWTQIPAESQMRRGGEPRWNHRREGRFVPIGPKCHPTSARARGTISSLWNRLGTDESGNSRRHGLQRSIPACERRQHQDRRRSGGR